MLAVDADADDAAQETLVKVFSRARTFDRSRDALTWTLTLAAYEALTLRKRGARRRDTELPSTLTTGHETAEDSLIAREVESAASSLLGELRPEDRETLLASFDSRRGERAPLSASMRKRLQRALGRLRAAWGARHGLD